MKRFFLTLTLLALLTACSGQAQTPAPTVDVNATVAAFSSTMMAGTLTAQPTDTPLPTPTSTSTFTPEPTATFAITPTSTETLTPTPTVTLPPFYGEFTPAGLPAGVRRGYILFENETKISPVYLNITGKAERQDKPVYYRYTFEGRQHRYEIPFGTYDYVIFLGEKKMFSGSFRINNFDKTTFFIRDNKVVIIGP